MRAAAGYLIAPVRGVAVLSIRTAAISVGVQALTDTVYGLALVVHMMTVPDAGLVDISELFLAAACSCYCYQC